MSVECWDLFLGFVNLINAVLLIWAFVFLFLYWWEMRKSRRELERLRDVLQRALRRERGKREGIE